MKQLTVKAVLTVGLLTLSGAASAMQVYLTEYGSRAASGTAYVGFFDGSDSKPASTATWDWDGTTLTQTGGFLQANHYIGSTPAGTYYFSDRVTGLVIDTVNQTTAATTYECIEGAFGAFTGASSCGNYSLNANGNESVINYNVGGDAACSQLVLGGDDTQTAGSPYRGLYSYDGDPTCGNHLERGALDMIQVVSDTTGIGGGLTLANWNSDNPVDVACIAAPPTAGNAACNRAHWMIFSTTPPIPVPAAVWLFGSAIGLLGVARRRAMA